MSEPHSINTIPVRLKTTSIHEHTIQTSKYYSKGTYSVNSHSQKELAHWTVHVTVQNYVCSMGLDRKNCICAAGCPKVTP